MDSAKRVPVLDGLRAISILLVLCAHMLPLGPKSLQLNYAAGAMGMSLFFCLSGFLITSTLRHNSDILEFTVRRLARILPLAYAYTFFVFTIVYFDPAAAFWTASFLVNYLTAYMVDGLNNHFWSLCVEVHFYGAIALVVLLAGKRGLWIVWPACLLFTGLRVCEGVVIAIQTHLRVDEILAGACVATLYTGSWRNRRLSLPIAGTAVILWFLSSSPYFGPLEYVRPYAAASVLAATLFSSETIAGRYLSSRLLSYIAAISYALYVIHPLTLYGWFNEGSVLDRYLLKRPISFIILFAAAHISTFHWEKIWIRSSHKFLQNRRARLTQQPV